jgi:uncharacterized protein with PQ loop repeat
MMKNFVAICERAEILAKTHIGKKCFEQYKALHLGDMSCNKLLLSKILSLGIVTGGLIVKVPQIIKLLKSGSATGMSLISLWIETFALLVAITYNMRKGFPFMTFGESFFIFMQNNVLISIIIYLGAIKENHQKLSMMGLFLVFLWLTFVSGLSFAMLDWVAFQVVSQLQSATIGLLIGARLPQILKNYQAQSTGQLSFVTTGLMWAGSMARVYTTSLEIRDPKLLVCVTASAILNSILLTQIFTYWHKEVEEKPKKD